MDAQVEIQNLMRQLNNLNTRQPITDQPQQPEAQAPATAAQVAEIVESSLKKAMPQLMGMVQLVDDFFQRALPPEELAAFKGYRDAGAPGMKELIESDRLYPIAQMLWDEIKTAATPAEGEPK